MKGSREIKIHLNQEIIGSLSISNNAIAAYSILRSIMKQDKSEYVITANQLLFEGTGCKQFSNYNKDCFLRGLNELVQKNIIALQHKFNNSEKLINLSNIALVKGDGIKFTEIELSEIQTILNNCGTNRYSILRYFILLIGTFNPNITVYLSEFDSASRILSTMTIEYFCKLTGLSKATIMTYNKILEDLKLVYIYHAADFYHTGNYTIKSPPNIYGRYCDKAYIDKYVKNDALYRGYEKYTPNGKSTTNHKRRLAQKYNRIVVGAGKYSVSEIQEVYDYISEQNKYYQTQYEKNKWDPFKEKIRDLSILKNILQGEFD